ncbi:MAG: hypothetical protein FJ010_10880 [Chloroflexi bacterium]|nr:hypothetical protein [Chloroflexota bacterium]
MSRVINPNKPGTERNRLIRAVVLALREMMKEPQPNERARDMAAFIALSLEAITETVETAVTAWEKRDYWIKADRFRMEWLWADRLGRAMRNAVLAEDWGQVALVAVQVGQALGDVQVSSRHRMGKPWVGAWKQLQISR